MSQTHQPDKEEADAEEKQDTEEDVHQEEQPKEILDDNNLDFTTAGGTLIPTSKTGLEFASHLFNSVDANDVMLKPDPPGFRYGRKRFLKVSTTALEFADNLLKTIDGTPETTSTTEPDDKASTLSRFKSPIKNKPFISHSTSSFTKLKPQSTNCPYSAHQGSEPSATSPTVEDCEVQDLLQAFLHDETDDNTTEWTINLKPQMQIETTKDSQPSSNTLQESSFKTTGPLSPPPINTDNSQILSEFDEFTNQEIKIDKVVADNKFIDGNYEVKKVGIESTFTVNEEEALDQVLIDEGLITQANKIDSSDDEELLLATPPPRKLQSSSYMHGSSRKRKLSKKTTQSLRSLKKSPTTTSTPINVSHFVEKPDNSRSTPNKMTSPLDVESFTSKTLGTLNVNMFLEWLFDKITVLCPLEPEQDVIPLIQKQVDKPKTLYLMEKKLKEVIEDPVRLQVNTTVDVYKLLAVIIRQEIQQELDMVTRAYQKSINVLASLNECD